jgi:hypothetical protein
MFYNQNQMKYRITPIPSPRAVARIAVPLAGHADTQARPSRGCQRRALWWSRSPFEGWFSMPPLLAAPRQIGSLTGRHALDATKGVAW